MPALVAGVVLLGLLLLLARGYARANPRYLSKGLRLSAGVILALLTIALVLTGRAAFAFLTAGAAWLLLFGARAPWTRTGYRRNGPGPDQNRSRSGQLRTNSMSRAEALKVLGLEEGATVADIRAAHRRLIQQIHPDKGGTDYLAAKINEAKDVLLRR
jgi:hypothetical protein